MATKNDKGIEDLPGLKSFFGIGCLDVQGYDDLPLGGRWSLNHSCRVKAAIAAAVGKVDEWC